MLDKAYKLIERCACICEQCDNYMALYKELATGKYFLECDVCPDFRYVKVEG